MKTLILFYSRTGTTKIVAEKMAAALSSEIEEVIDKKDRSGPIGYFTGGRDAFKKSLTNIGPIKNEITAYDLIIIGTPVWAGTMAPAIRTLIMAHKQNFKKLAFFTTQGGERVQKVLGDMEVLTGVKPEETMILTTREVKKNEADGKIAGYIEKLKLI
jgi:flavodoxin